MHPFLYTSHYINQYIFKVVLYIVTAFCLNKPSLVGKHFAFKEDVYDIDPGFTLTPLSLFT